MKTTTTGHTTTQPAGHTPGPWDLSQRNPYPGCRYAIMPDANGHGWNIAHVCNGEDAAANARLIASAPDLLAALEDVTQELDEWLVDMCVPVATREKIEYARAAIARARGMGVEK